MKFISITSMLLLLALAGCRTLSNTMTVTVTDEVANPGTYPLSGKATVQDAIDAAGGLSELRTPFTPHDAVVTQPDGTKVNVLIKDWGNTFIQDGDQVQVPRYFF